MNTYSARISPATVPSSVEDAEEGEEDEGEDEEEGGEVCLGHLVDSRSEAFTSNLNHKYLRFLTLYTCCKVRRQ